MKRLLILILASLPLNVFAWGPPDFALNFSTETRSVSVSSTPTKPTLLFSQESYIQRTWIINPSSFTIYIATSNVSISTTSNFGIPGVTAGNTPTIFSPDGVNSPFTGQLWGVSGDVAPPPSIKVFRSK